jgi:hypothetical protein
MRGATSVQRLLMTMRWLLTTLVSCSISAAPAAGGESHTPAFLDFTLTSNLNVSVVGLPQNPFLIQGQVSDEIPAQLTDKFLIADFQQARRIRFGK